MKRLLILFITLLAGGLCTVVCAGLGGEKPYWLLYPLETTRQKIDFYQNMRFLSYQDDDLQLNAVVLNNPLQEGGYADLAVFASKPVSLKDARSREGAVAHMEGDALVQAMDSGALFDAPKVDKALVPRMQAHGCAPQSKGEGRTFDELEPNQQALIRLRQNYMKASASDVTAAVREAHVFRLLVPAHKSDSPLVIHLEAEGKTHTLRMQLQPID